VIFFELFFSDQFYRVCLKRKEFIPNSTFTVMDVIYQKFTVIFCSLFLVLITLNYLLFINISSIQFSKR